MTKNIDRVFRSALANGVFPAADVLAAKGGEVVFESHYGNAREHTCFDISSLTKPVATATIAMMLVAQELLRLEDSVYQWLAGARKPEHKLITVRQLLNHTSGLPAWQPYYRELPISLVGTEAGKRILLDACFNEDLLSEPGEKILYSDIGYMILGELLEQAGSEPLDALFSQMVTKPLNLHDTFFMRTIGAPISTSSRHTTTSADQHVPTPKHGLPKERRTREYGEHLRFAPTEDCPWRDRVIHGEVHDQNAYALGGVAGHAGVFSTARDLHRFVLELTNSYNGKSNWIPKDIVHQFLSTNKTKPAGVEYVLGWDRPSKRNSSSGLNFSANSIGHLGYTGCSTWIDLEKDFWIILLTNRIHPTPMNEKIKAFRPMIHDLIYDELVG